MSRSKSKEPDYNAIGRSVYALSDVHIDRKTLFKTAFLKGMFSGLGGVIGATVLLALLIWILSLFNELPLIGRLFETLQQTVEQTP